MAYQDITAVIQVYYKDGWYAWPTNNGNVHCWYGDPIGPFDTMVDAVQAIADELHALDKEG